MTVAQHKVVTLHYKVVDVDSGQVIDSSENSDPLVYLHGAQNIIPGLENALEGKDVGDEIEVTVAPEDAYGERSDERIQKVPMEAFKDIEKVEPGMAVTAQTEHGPVNLVVTEVDESTVTVDANHPLAGKSLTFNVKIEEVRDASEEEKAHGHVHGPDGHAH
ncbi:MAG: peptidylprolyl isomerase [Ketobacteraceae bacterium]|nr:peptidylprolyl isomerase [Ketobacteraceae bacterium]